MKKNSERLERRKLRQKVREQLRMKEAKIFDETHQPPFGPPPLGSCIEIDFNDIAINGEK